MGTGNRSDGLVPQIKGLRFSRQNGYNPAMKILLATLHAKYVHNSLALPCLAAACRGVEGVTTVIREFTVNEPSDHILRAIVDEEADVVAFSCYIWNIGETLKLASDLKQISPETFIVLGGPEASFGVFELMTLNPAIDCVVRGEGEETFRELIACLAGGDGGRDLLEHPPDGIICRSDDGIVAAPERAVIKDLDSIPSPFSAGLADLAKPLVYYETSRGCPFSCAFCLSSLDREVRSFSMERIRCDLGILLNSGVQTVKFVDRTFNYSATRADDIWAYILKENRTSRFHFEIAADLLSEENFRLLRQVPPGIFRFEIGVQSGEDETLERVGRRSDLTQLFANVRRLREETGVVVHLDLVAGLPGEDFPGFLRSLQRLIDLFYSGDQRRGGEFHIQVELLKVLKGSPMRKIAAEEKYAFSGAPPYRVLRTPWLSYAEICRIDAISRLIDLVINSGRFRTVLARTATARPVSAFFSAAADFWLNAGLSTTLSLSALFEALWRFAGDYLPEPELDGFRDALCFDFCLAEYPSVSKLPGFFKDRANDRKGNTREDNSSYMQKLDIPPDSRVRSFRHPFSRDYLGTPWGKGPAEFLFVYISAPGRGLRVEVMKV
jgi:anaerobic magnesium-protoporphyrin IX monomethyl ester cyclase